MFYVDFCNHAETELIRSPPYIITSYGMAVDDDDDDGYIHPSVLIHGSIMVVVVPFL